ncbi:glycosyltransferase family 39 protein [Candidatus Gracilibacteria bacterium]|nr:glycosyltransferase family 39 protein [Candidatus Gracilibacteria bacterium]
MLMRNAALLLLLLIYLLFASIYNLSVPIGEGPDEAGHFRYVLFLASEGRLPVQRAEAKESDVPGEGHQPPLAYALATAAVAWLPAEEHVLEMSANSNFVWSGGDEPGAFHRGSREYWPFSPQIRAWHLTRAINMLWGLVTIICTYQAARVLMGQGSGFRTQNSEGRVRHRWCGNMVPMLAAGLVAFNPQFLFMSALVSNDALLTALGAVVLWLALAQEPRAKNQRTKDIAYSIALGAVFGLALLTKQSALLLGPLLLWAGWRASGGHLASFIRYSLTWGSTALAVAGWWYLRNWQLYGDLFGLGAFKAEFSTQPFDWQRVEAWLGGILQLFASFWARFGWMSLPAPRWMLTIYAVIGVAAFVGLIRWAAAGQREPGVRSQESGVRSQESGEQWDSFFRSPRFGLTLPIGMALLWIVSFALTAGLVAWQGRLLFPALSAIAIGMALGLSEVVARLNWLLSATRGHRA